MIVCPPFQQYEFPSTDHKRLPNGSFIETTKQMGSNDNAKSKFAIADIGSLLQIESTIFIIFHIRHITRLPILFCWAVLHSRLTKSTKPYT